MTSGILVARGLLNQVFPGEWEWHQRGQRSLAGKQKRGPELITPLPAGESFRINIGDTGESLFRLLH